MTDLKKPLTRVVVLNRPRDGKRAGGPRSGRYAVTLEPNGLLTFREVGRRQRFTVTLESCFVLAARIAAEGLRRDRQARRTALKALNAAWRREGKR